MKTLNLTFKGNLGKTHVLKLNYANDNLDKAAAERAMTKLANLHLFVKNGEELYFKPVSAKYSDTLTTEIYSAKAEEKQTA